MAQPYHSSEFSTTTGRVRYITRVNQAEQRDRGYGVAMKYDYDTFSFSGLSQLASCAHSFKLTRIDKVDEPMSFAASAGSAWHSAADLVDELLMQEGEVPF